MSGRIEIGFTARKDPKTGRYMPAEPIYAERDAGTDAAEAGMIRSAGKVFAEALKACIEAGTFRADGQSA